MKKIIFLLFAICLPNFSYANAEIKIPYSVIDITKNKEMKANTGFLKNLLIRQILKNSSINGIELKDFNADNLMDYLNSDKIFQKYGTNMLKDPITGTVLEFVADGECKKSDSCYINVYFSSAIGQSDNKTAPYKIKIERNNNEGINLSFPDFNE